MKKFVVLILMLAGAYIVYDRVIKGKEVLEVNADKQITTNQSMDINSPAITPSRYGLVRGTVKNVSDDEVTNIVLKYKLNGEPVEARIDELDPGEQKKFATKSIMLKHQEVTFYLVEMSYE
jgi:hypothetical protein